MNSRYQEWLEHLFDHEVRGHLLPAWYWDDDAPSFEASANETTDLISQTFLYAGRDLTKYSDAQVDQGIWYLATPEGSNFMFDINSTEVPLAKRLETIRNIFHLYSDCYAKRCDESLGHLSEVGSALNSSCYMFWDGCPITYLKKVNATEAKKTQDAILSVLEKILTIEHRACREGALHGLGHIFRSCPERVHEIIDDFLNKTNLDNKLLAYARYAREGKVQ